MGRTVYLIDDERDFTDLTGTLLGLNGFSVESNNDPRAGLEQLKNRSYDAVVIDIMMPYLSGLKVMEELRTLPAYAKAALFVLSSKKLTDDERKFLASNDIQFLQKPFDPQTLVQLISERLSG